MHLLYNDIYRYSDFEKKKSLGIGAYGRVYLTKCSGHLYALKELDFSLATEEVRIEREKRTLGNIWESK